MSSNLCIYMDHGDLWRVETVKTADYGYLRLYGYRPKSVTAGYGCSLRLYASSACDDSAA